MALSYQVTKEWVVITYNYHFVSVPLKTALHSLLFFLLPLP